MPYEDQTESESEDYFPNSPLVEPMFNMEEDAAAEYEDTSCQSPDADASLEAFGHYTEEPECAPADEPTWLEGVASWIVAEREDIEEEKAKKAAAAGDPSKKAPEPKETVKKQHEAGSATVNGAINPDGTVASGGVSLKHEEDDKDAGLKKTTQIGGEGKITATGGAGKMTFGVGQTKLDGPKEEARAAKERAENFEHVRQKQDGEIERDAKYVPSAEAKAKPVPGSSTKLITGGGYDERQGGHALVGAEHDRTNADGSKTNVTGSAQLTAAPDGSHSGAAAFDVSRKDAEGKKKLSGGGGVEADKNGVSLKANVENKHGGAGGEIILKDGETGARGNAKGGTPTVQLSIAGGKIVKFLPPNQLPSGTWSVTYVVTKELGVGGSANTDPEAKGTKYGAGFNVSETNQLSVTKTFGSEAEALAFRTAESVGDPVFPQSASQAASMKPGEKFVLGESSTGSGDASVGGTYGTLGIGGSISEGERTSVEMLADHSVFAERTTTTDSTGKINYTAPGGLAGVSGANTDTDTVRIKIKVDIGTEEAPNEAGRAAYHRFLDTADTIAPAQVVSSTTSKGKTKGREISLGPLKGFDINKVTESTTYDDQGMLEETTGEHKSGWEIKPLDMSGSHGTKLEALQRNDDQRAYVVTSSVKQDGAYDTIQHLHAATGAGIRGEEELEGMKSSGTWEVQSVMEPTAVDRFVKHVNDGHYNPDFVMDGSGKTEDSTHTYFDAGDELEDRLKKAGDDQDKQRSAVAKFVAEGGEPAVAQMRALGGSSKEFFVTLTNGKDEIDPNFRGIEGRLDTEAQIAALQGRSEANGADPVHLLDDIKLASAKVRSRINGITPERYPDLPPGLMTTEVGRSTNDLARLEALAAPLRARVNEARLANLSPAERAAREKQTEVGADLDAMGPADQGTIGLLGAAKTDPGVIQAIKMKEMNRARAAAEQQRTAARAAQQHHTGAGWKTSSRRTRDRVIDSAGGGDWERQYQSADAAVIAGTTTFASACNSETAALSVPETDDANINGSLGLISGAIASFNSARTQFADAVSAYDAIADANPDYLRQ